MQVIILAGGRGSRLAEETSVRPKPMVEVGGKPIVWHIMQIYASHGFNNFVIACGYKGEIIKEYFNNSLGAGFEYAYTYPGINRVLQAAGRLIRTEKDRGVVLLIDQRYARFQYKSLLREEWDPVWTHDTRQLTDALRKFWSDSRSPQSRRERKD